MSVADSRAGTGIDPYETSAAVLFTGIRVGSK
jgi:hypothetical protein